MEKIMKPGMKVLDVGCATGGLYHALKEKYGQVFYTGVDIAENMIKRAKELAPEATFINGNILDEGVIEKNHQFDLVTATGIFQHEPRHQELLKTMLDCVKPDGYVLFDVKLFAVQPTLRDIEHSYVDYANRLYFIVFNFNEFINFILPRPEVNSIEVYGYYTGANENVRLPQSVEEEVCSAHVLLKCDQRNEKTPLKLELNLPAEFIVNYFKDKSCTSL